MDKGYRLDEGIIQMPSRKERGAYMEEDRRWATFLANMEELLGEGYPAYLASFSQPWNRGLRVNTGKISLAQLASRLDGARLEDGCGPGCGAGAGGARKHGPRLLAPVPWILNGAYYDPDWAAAKDPYYYAGLYYLQEPSAMTPASRLPVAPGDMVLDLCAAPGGKATELGARLKGKGILFANDISNSRAKALLKNLELFGIANICVTSESPGKLAKALPGFFDKILVDAPCSGEGMFRREPDMIKDWTERGPAYYAPIQQDILCQAVRLLKPGGYLLYSTCTFSKKEDEENVVWLLERFPAMELVPLELFPGASDGFGLSGVLRLFPHKIKGEGHFLALFHKKQLVGDAGEEDAFFEKGHTSKGKGRRGTIAAEPSPKRERVPSGLAAFLKDLYADRLVKLQPEKIRQVQDKLFYLPEGFPKEAKLRYLRTGLYLGCLKKERFEPSQALAMTLRPEELACAIRFSHEDERVIRYLKGETICYGEEEMRGSGKTEDKEQGGKPTGWRLICLDDFPLGWAKLSGGALKNKYYPGWRYL